MVFCVCVGHTVVGGFNNADGARKCIRRLASGCKPQIKKCHPILTERVAKYCSNETRQIINYKPSPRMLKPGEFTL